MVKIINIIPSAENHSVEVPEEMYGKEVIIEIKDKTTSNQTLESKINSNANSILAHFGKIKDFPNIEQLRDQTNPKKW